jgi:hypothetical protein
VSLSAPDAAGEEGAGAAAAGALASSSDMSAVYVCIFVCLKDLSVIVCDGNGMMQKKAASPPPISLLGSRGFLFCLCMHIHTPKLMKIIDTKSPQSIQNTPYIYRESDAGDAACFFITLVLVLHTTPATHPSISSKHQILICSN